MDLNYIALGAGFGAGLFVAGAGILGNLTSWQEFDSLLFARSVMIHGLAGATAGFLTGDVQEAIIAAFAGYYAVKGVRKRMDIVRENGEAAPPAQ